MRLWYDLDGVLADFDKGVGQILGTDNIYKYEFQYGSEQFWAEINKHPNPFDSFDLMPGADILWSTTEHLNPHILTALPKTNRDHVDAQKRKWVARHLGHGVPVITCLGHEKPDYCEAGDILIDDRAVNHMKWEQRGGIFIHHQDALTTWVRLKELGVI